MVHLHTHDVGSRHSSLFENSNDVIQRLFHLGFSAIVDT
jgi:hypothetical protein